MSHPPVFVALLLDLLQEHMLAQVEELICGDDVGDGAGLGVLECAATEIAIELNDLAGGKGARAHHECKLDVPLVTLVLIMSDCLLEG